CRFTAIPPINRWAIIIRRLRRLFGQRRLKCKLLRGGYLSLLLHLEGIDKSYDGVHALRGVHFELRAGEVHALVGENGAGKSTLIKIITGAVSSDAGRIRVEDQPVVDSSPAQTKELGIAAIYQQPALFPELTVAENISLGLEGAGFWRRVDWEQRRSRARGL